MESISGPSEAARSKKKQTCAHSRGPTIPAACPTNSPQQHCLVKKWAGQVNNIRAAVLPETCRAWLWILKWKKCGTTRTPAIEPDVRSNRVPGQNGSDQKPNRTVKELQMFWRKEAGTVPKVLKEALNYSGNDSLQFVDQQELRFSPYKTPLPTQ